MVSEVHKAAYQIPAFRHSPLNQKSGRADFTVLNVFIKLLESEEIQINTLIYSMEDKTEDILKSFALSEEDAKKYSVVIEKFIRHFVKHCNIIYMIEPSLIAVHNKREK